MHAVGSGVGVALLQLAKAFGATVAGTSRTPGKLRRAEALGLDHPMHVTEGFRPPDDLADWADVITDLVGGPYLSGNLRAVAPGGRIVVIGLTGGRRGELDLGRLLTKRVRLIGTVLRSRAREEKTQLVRAFVDEVLPLLARGAIVPVVDRVFPATEARAAHRYLEANRNFGAVVLRWE